MYCGKWMNGRATTLVRAFFGAGCHSFRFFSCALRSLMLRPYPRFWARRRLFWQNAQHRKTIVEQVLSSVDANGLERNAEANFCRLSLADIAMRIQVSCTHTCPARSLSLPLRFLPFVGRSQIIQSQKYYYFKNTKEILKCLVIWCSFSLGKCSARAWYSAFARSRAKRGARRPVTVWQLQPVTNSASITSGEVSSARILSTSGGRRKTQSDSRKMILAFSDA